MNKRIRPIELIICWIKMLNIRAEWLRNSFSSFLKILH